MAVLALGISASAANPFSDVTPNDWAYQQSSICSNRASLSAIRTVPSAAKETSPVSKWHRSLHACWPMKIR